MDPKDQVGVKRVMWEPLKEPPNTVNVDILEGKQTEVKLYNNVGSLVLVDCSPRIVPKGRGSDYMTVRAARVSYGLDLKTPSQDKGLINYLLRNHHTSPFEFVSFTFRAEVPIFVARQWQRHRTWNFNEESARYSVMVDKFFTPTSLRTQDTVNKQSSVDGFIKNEDELLSEYTKHMESSYDLYTKMLDNGVTRELARCVLPVSLMTTIYGQIDLNNLFKFLSLRTDEHAQKEIRELADGMLLLIRDIVPDAVEAWDQYHRNSLTLTGKEVEAIRNGNDRIAGISRNENIEFEKKLKKLSLIL